LWEQTPISQSNLIRRLSQQFINSLFAASRHHTELLYAAAVRRFTHIEIALVVDAHAVRADHLAHLMAAVAERTHNWEEGNGHFGVLSTAGNLVFTGDPAPNFVGLNARTGEPLWHANLGNPISNGPITYELNATQYLVVAAGDTLFAFALLQ